MNVHLNGLLLCSAGIDGGSFLDVTVAASVFGEHSASLLISGMQDRTDGGTAHVYWLDDEPLADGDVLTIAPVDLTVATQPHSIVPTDSPEYIEQQREYEEFLGAHIWPQPEPMRRRANVTFALSFSRVPSLRASMALGHEHLLCGVSWNMWRPERTRASVRSFSGESKLAWLQSEIPLGEALRVEVRV